MMDAGRHPNIELMAYSEVEDVAGHVGNFKVRVRKQARYVIESECTACGDCVPVCPIVQPDEFQMGLSTRRAIYIPFPQAVPSAYLINMDECLGDNPIACGKCQEVCDKKCIDFDMQDEMHRTERGGDYRRHRDGCLRPHAAGRVWLYQLRKRHHQHGVRAADLGRRPHRRALSSAPRTSPGRSRSALSSAWAPARPIRPPTPTAAGATPTAPTSAA